jgi:hypothetical protein
LALTTRILSFLERFSKNFCSENLTTAILSFKIQKNAEQAFGGAAIGWPTL